MLQRIDEGIQQQLTVAQQHGIEKRRQGFRVGGQHRSASEHDRIVIPPGFGPDWNVLVLQQLRKHRAIQLPTQGESEQVAVAGQWVALVREQSPDIHIAALGQGRPDDLIPEAGDAHGVGAGKGQDGLEGVGVRLGRIEQQRFLVQLRSPLEGGSGGGGGSNCRRWRLSCSWFSSSESRSIPIWRS